MKVLVLGAGVTGLSVAYQLAKEGHQVSVLDQHPGVGQGASYANGGQLSYSYVTPLASPKTLAALPALIFGADTPIRVHPRLDPHQWSWAAQFIAACTDQRSRSTIQSLLTLTSTSRQALAELVASEGINFNLTSSGKLLIFADDGGFKRARALAAYQARFGCEQQALSRKECLDLEPSLGQLSKPLVGGIFTSTDQTGDCHLFCRALQRVLTDRYAVEMVLGSKLKALRPKNGRIVAAITEIGDIEADAYVLCLGMGSRAIVRPLGFDLPILGLKGYSLTLPVLSDAAPRISITDTAQRVVYARLGQRLRVAGIADVDSREDFVRSTRVRQLQRQARANFQSGLDHERAEVWTGTRPATPTGLPIVGRSNVSNLFLNVGHGALGFTLAMATAKLAANHISAAKLPS